MRTTRKLDASAKRKKQGGGGRGAKKLSIFLSLASLASRPLPRRARASRSLRLLFCVEKSRGCGQSKFLRKNTPEECFLLIPSLMKHKIEKVQIYFHIVL